MRYRIKECRVGNESNFRIQKRFLFWWYDMLEFNPIVDAHFGLIFKTYDEAIQYIKDELVKPQGVYIHAVTMEQLK